MNPPSDPVAPEPEPTEDSIEALREISATRTILEALDSRLPKMEERIIERHKKSIFWWKVATGVSMAAAFTGIGASIYALGLGNKVDRNQKDQEAYQIQSEVNICEGGNEIREGIQDVLLLATPSKNPDDLSPLQREAYNVFEPIECTPEAIRERVQGGQ